MTKKNTQVDDAIKFAWAYLILHGKFTSGEWSYYGSCWEEPERHKYVSWKEEVKRQLEFQEKVVKIGIDWDKSGVPEVDNYEGFAGTFISYNTQCLGTLGTLVLLNGEKFLIGSSNNDAAHLAKTAKKMMQKPGESEVERFAKKL